MYRVSEFIVSRRLSTVLIFLVQASVAKSLAADLAPATMPAYHSPYSVHYTNPVEVLLADVLSGERGRVESQSTFPFSEWASAQMLKRYGAWGPPSKVYEPPAGASEWSAAFKRERVIALAMRYEGYSYQHHHLPDWEPPAGWPWKEVGCGHNAKGVDCSNFTGFVYNVTLGIKLTGDVVKQSEEITATTTAGKVAVRAIEKPATYSDCVRQLRTGDLLYIKSKQGEVSHVILWIGSIGHSPDGAPLVLDSTGTGHTNSAGQKIPDGVHLRPFLKNSWYWNSLSHVHRVIED